MVYIILDFDDGYLNNYNFAYNICKKYNIKFNINLIGKFKDNNNDRFLNSNQMAELKNYGCTFGFHTYNHINMTELNNNEIEKEIINNYEYSQIFCFPYSKYNDNIINIVRNKYKILVGNPSNMYNNISDIYNNILNRITIKNTTTLTDIIKIINPYYNNNDKFFILNFHQILPININNLEYVQTTNFLEDLIIWLMSNQYPIITYNLLENIKLNQFNLINHKKCNCTSLLCCENEIKFSIIYKVLSAIDTKKNTNFEQFFNSLSKSIRQDYKRFNKYYNVKMFKIADYADDFYQIHISTDIRHGIKIPSYYYNYKPDYYKNKYRDQNNNISCTNHFILYFGIFKEDKLVGFIELRKCCETFNYANILGHKDYLKDSIMTILNIHVIKYIYENFYTNNIIIYYGIVYPNSSLQNWKNRNGFNKYIYYNYDRFSIS